MQLLNITQIAKENGMAPIVAVATQRLLRHVALGGFLGANADHYAFGVVNKDGRVIKSGFDEFCYEIRIEALRLAYIINPQLDIHSQQNFEACCLSD